METFIDCYYDYKTNKNRGCYSCKDGTIEFDDSHDMIFINYVKSNNTYALKNLIIEINKNTTKELVIPAIGDYLKEFNIDNLGNNKKMLNVGGDAVLVDEHVTIDEYIKNRGY